MTFFDRKEEVIDLALTPYGRYKLSLGKLKPTYYAFFDDDVVYDTDHCMLASGSFIEHQNNIEKRIKETPRMHSQCVFTERKSDINPVNNEFPQNYFDRNYGLMSPLGDSDINTDFAPSWKMDLLKGQIAHAQIYHTGSGPNYQIPQINAKIMKFEPHLGFTTQGPDNNFDNDERQVYEYVDGTFLDIREDFLLLEVGELNAPFERENYEVEIFEIKEDPGRGIFTYEFTVPRTVGQKLERLVPLYFTNSPLYTTEDTGFAGGAGDIELQEESTTNSILVSAPDPNNVNYYLDISIDSEIDQNIMCKYKDFDKSTSVFIDREFNCPEEPEQVDIDQYTTDITDITGDICQ